MTHSEVEAVRKRLLLLTSLPHAQCDLAEAALLIAAEHTPRLDVSAELRRLDAWARQAAPALREAQSAEQQAEGLIAAIHGELEFAGNASDYYDPLNSYFQAVLERRTGIPITLALVYIELGRRLGLQVRGIAFPGHFLVRVGSAPGVIVDPFHGKALTPADCQQRLAAALGPGARLGPEHLTEAEPKEIIVRILRNLKHVFLARATRAGSSASEAASVARGDAERSALASCDRIVMLEPDEPVELRDRGLVHGRMGHATEAYADLERALELAPDAPWADSIRQGLPALRHLAGPLN